MYNVWFPPLAGWKDLSISFTCWVLLSLLFYIVRVRPNVISLNGHSTLMIVLLFFFIGKKFVENERAKDFYIYFPSCGSSEICWSLKSSWNTREYPFYIMKKQFVRCPRCRELERSEQEISEFIEENSSVVRKRETLRFVLRAEKERTEIFSVENGFTRHRELHLLNNPKVQALYRMTKWK